MKLRWTRASRDLRLKLTDVSNLPGINGLHRGKISAGGRKALLRNSPYPPLKIRKAGLVPNIRACRIIGTGAVPNIRACRIIGAWLVPNIRTLPDNRYKACAEHPEAAG